MEFLSLSEAVARHVHDGDRIALEGFTHLIPFAAAHEIIRQRRRDLTLIRMTPDLIYDQMIGMGTARKLVFSWGGNPGVGSLHRLRDAGGRGGALGPDVPRCGGQSAHRNGKVLGEESIGVEKEAARAAGLPIVRGEEIVN